MKTVGYYKKAGLEFVSGDVRGSWVENHGDITLCPALAEEINNNASDYVLNSNIKSFEWRANPTKKPSFSGLIEFTYYGEGCEMQECMHSNNIDWLLVKKWRPSLNQSTTQTETPQEKGAFKAMTESKPIFTQAMAGAGELPPVGSEFTSAPNNDIKITCLYASKFAVIGLLDTGLECVFNLHLPDIDYKFAPIKTEREKAIDEMQEVVCSQGFLAKMDVSFGIAEEIYNANYRKLTPSQAKAYDDKTEYFGEDYK